MFKRKTCTDLAPGKRLSLRRRSSQFHGNTRVSEFHSSPKIFCIGFNFWTVPVLCKNGARLLFSEDNFEMVLMLAGSFPQWRWQTENRRMCHTMRGIRWFLFQALQIYLLSYIAWNHSRRNHLLTAFSDDSGDREIQLMLNLGELGEGRGRFLASA